MEDKRCPSKGVKPIVMKRKRKKAAMTRPSPSELMNSFLFGACCQRGSDIWVPSSSFYLNFCLIELYLWTCKNYVLVSCLVIMNFVNLFDNL
jgi:hypothetical protein